MTISNAQIKNWTSLKKVAGRRQAGLFMIEGTRAVCDTAHLFDTVAVLATEAWIAAHPDEARSAGAQQVPSKDLSRLSSMTTPQGVVAICRIPRHNFDPSVIAPQLVVALDTIQDPGNLGTIIRTADWMGVNHIVASNDTADCFAPKVVQATMGSLARVAVHYGDLPQMLADLKAHGNLIAATALHGDNLYEIAQREAITLVIGNEGNGVSAPVLKMADMCLTIPSYPPGEARCESLNAAVATAIALSHLRFN